MGEVLSFGFNLAVLDLSDRKENDTYCIIAIEDKKMGFNYIILHEFISLHHVILLKALLCSYELNTLDACWIPVDVWSNSSRCRIISVYLFARFLFVCVGAWDSRVVSYWIDTLVLKKTREILPLLYCSTISSSRENQRSALFCLCGHCSWFFAQCS